MPSIKRRKLAIRYHGNYCGPNWSGGKYQGSIKGKPGTATDEFDETCRIHDTAYASTKDDNELSRADARFYRDNIGRGFKRSVAAMAVGAQGYLRTKFSSAQKAQTNSLSSFPQKETGITQMAKRSPSRSNSRMRTPSRGRGSVPGGMPTPGRSPGRRSPSRSTSRSSARMSSVSSRASASAVSSRTKHGLSSIKYTKKKLSQYEKDLNKCMRKGAVTTYEWGIDTTDAEQAIVLGHTTHASIPFWKALGRAIVKFVAVKKNVHVNSWDAVPSVEFTNTSGQFTFEYKKDFNDTTADLSTTVPVTTSQTWATIADNVAAEIRDVAMTLTEDATHKIWLRRISYRSDAFSEGHVSFDASQMKVHVVVKSILKVQNITTPSTDESDDTADVVDAIHLNGYIYNAKGNGFYGPKLDANQSFVGNQNQGLIIKEIDSAAKKTILKPTPRGFFSNSASRRKMLISAGDIKQSVLTHNRGFSFNKNMQHLFTPIGDISSGVGGDLQVPSYMGKASMFYVEHAIKPRDEYPKIKMFGQLDYTIGCWIELPQARKTPPEIDMGFYAP